MIVLITGVAGLIGSRLADWIIENKPDVDVIGVDNLSGGYIENVNQKVKFINVDLLTTELTSIFDMYKPDVVYHFGAYAAEGLSPFIRTYNYQNNLVVTTRIVNECIRHNVRRLVFTSSMAVYGNGSGEGKPFDESDRPCPIDPYGIAKYAAEQDIRVAGEQHGLDWCIIRPHNIYGVKQNIWDKYRNVLGIWMYQYLNNKPITIFGDGQQKRAFSYIDDCLEPLWKSGNNKNASRQIINIGSSISCTLNEANNILRNVMGGGDVVYLEARHEVKNAYSTYKKSEDLLDFKDKTPLKVGLTSMWRWVLAQPKRQQKMWDKYEIDNGIYKFWRI